MADEIIDKHYQFAHNRANLGPRPELIYQYTRSQLAH